MFPISASHRSESESQIGIYRGFIEKFGLFWKHREALLPISQKKERISLKASMNLLQSSSAKSHALPRHCKGVGHIPINYKARSLLQNAEGVKKRFRKEKSKAVILSKKTWEEVYQYYTSYQPSKIPTGGGGRGAYRKVLAGMGFPGVNRSYDRIIHWLLRGELWSQ